MNVCRLTLIGSVRSLTLMMAVGYLIAVTGPARSDPPKGGEPEKAKLPEGALFRLPCPKSRANLAVLSLAVSPDGKTLAAGTDRSDDVNGFVELWDLASRQLLFQVPGSDGMMRVPSVAFSPDGQYIASATWYRAGRLWDVKTGKAVMKFDGHAEGVVAVAFSPKGDLVATGSPGGEISLWDLATKKRCDSYPINLPMDLTGLAISPDGGKLGITCRTGRVGVWSIADRKQLFIHACAKDYGYGIAFSPDGTKIVAGNEHGFISGLDAASGQELFRLDAPKLGCGVVSFSPDGKTLAATSRVVNTIALWEVASGRLRRVFQGSKEGNAAVDFFPDGKRLASGNKEGDIVIWDVVGALPKPGAAGPINDKQLEAWWDDLGSQDAAKAFTTVHALAGFPTEAVALIRNKVKPIPHADPQLIQRLIGQLDDDAFAARQAAFERLKDLGDPAEEALREAALSGPSAEVKSQAQILFRRVDTRGENGAGLRQIRAIETLEAIGTMEAKEVLQALAKGDPASRLTREAKAALHRLEKVK